mgnify:CR=1 FL=1
MSITSGVEIIKGYLPKLLQVPGVYRMLDEKGEPLYIGKAKNLPKRVVSYTKTEALPYRLQRMVSLTCSMEFIITKTEAEALLMEAQLIRELQPKFNIDLKDDKSFPYILLTGDKEYNMLLKYRGRKSHKGSYFGPFFSAAAVYETLHAMQRAFPLRTCTDATLKSRTRPCLEYQIKRCTAPCVGKISKEDYEQIVQEAKAFLSGKNSSLQQKLSSQMEEASNKMDYEKAATIRDRIHALTRIQNEHKLTVSGLFDTDVIALNNESGVISIEVFFIRGGQNMGNRTYYPTSGLTDAETLETFMMLFYQSSAQPAPQILTNIELENASAVEEALGIMHGKRPAIEVPQKGDKFKVVQTALMNAKDALRRKMAEDATQTRLLKMLCERFGLEAPPERIEVFDNSHNQGGDALGAMIVATPAGFDKKQYRKFNIKTAATNDDFAMMREVLTRRYAKAKDENNFPDIALIDGGAGQLSAARQVMDDLGVHQVKLIAIAKGPDRNAGLEEYHMVGKEPFRLERGSELAFFLQRLRDEAHRFVITGHRGKAVKNLKKSQLDEVEGVGPTRKKALLQHFGSVSSIKEATLESLMKVKGINRQTAEIIYNHFH